MRRARSVRASGRSQSGLRRRRAGRRRRNRRASRRRLGRLPRSRSWLERNVRRPWPRLNSRIVCLLPANSTLARKSCSDQGLPPIQNLSNTLPWRMNSEASPARYFWRMLSAHAGIAVWERRRRCGVDAGVAVGLGMGIRLENGLPDRPPWAWISCCHPRTGSGYSALSEAKDPAPTVRSFCRRILRCAQNDKAQGTRASSAPDRPSASPHTPS